MNDLNKVKNGIMRTNQPIDRFCSIKKYLNTEEKFSFISEYRELVKEHIKEHEGFESYIAFVFFHLLIVKYYTDISIELNYEDFDILQGNGIFNKIIESIGEDYKLLLNFVKE